MDANLALTKIKDVLWSIKWQDVSHETKVDEIATGLMVLQHESFKRGKITGARLGEQALTELVVKLSIQEVQIAQTNTATKSKKVSSETQVSTMKTCKCCGHKNASNSSYCYECGKYLDKQ